jgi:hypothetical protein
VILFLSIFLGFVLPAYVVWLAWTSGRGGFYEWLTKVLAALGFMGFLSYIVRWDVISTYLPLIWWALIVLGTLWGLIRLRGRSFAEGKTVRAMISGAVEPAIALALLFYALTGMLHGPTVDAGFPLTGGRFLVIHGGSNAMLNYHNPNRAQRYALDIVGIDDFGRRASGIEPTDLGDYVIDGAPVRSPCAGQVTEAVGDVPDNAIGTTNIESPAGNHVVIACGDVEVELAHFKQGTLAVAVGDEVIVGRTIAQVGNSGNTTEPHLHIHAVRAGTGGASSGEGVPLSFGGTFPVRNTVIAR